MSNNQDFPGLGDNNSSQQQAPDSWDMDLPKQDKPKKEKKKLKLGGGALNTEATEFSFDPSGGFGDFGFQPQQGGMDFGFQPQQGGMDFGFQPQQQDFGFQPQQQQEDQEPYYTYPDPTLGHAQNIIQDQFGNLFEIQEGEYLDNGQIFFYQEEENQDQFWDNYQQNNKNNNTQTQQKNKQQQQLPLKKDTKKKATKKDAKQPVPQQPRKIPKRLQKLAEQSDAAKAEEKVGPIKKQERFTPEQLKQKEQIKLDTEGDKFTKVDTVRESLNLVFIGHVDAGKSTLSGRVLMDAGEIDEKTIQQFEIEAKKNNREGWFFAYAMDISEDERSKGKTVETGKAFFQLNQRRFTLLDAPGHKNYVPNMIMGACQSDIACLIISSKQGEFESGFEKGGQTMEHVQLIRALGVQQLCIIVSKMDTNDWSQERYDYIVKNVSPWLKEQCGYENVPFIPINAFDGQNISGRVDPGICSWYEGQSFFEFLNTANIPKRDPAGGIKIPILDVQKEDGKQFVYGKVESGTIFEDIYVTTMPYRKTFQITEIYDAKDRRIFYAPPGENVKFKIKGSLNEDDIQRGFMICSTDELCGVSTEFQAEIQLLELPGSKQILSSGYTCVIHTHTAVQEIEINEIKAVHDKNHGKLVPATILKNGEKGIVNITAEKYLCLEKFENTPILGRFTLRDENVTIAFGTIKKYKPSFEFQRIQAKLLAEQKAKQQ